MLLPPSRAPLPTQVLPSRAMACERCGNRKKIDPLAAVGLRGYGLIKIPHKICEGAPRGPSGQLPQLVAKFTKSATITHSLVT
jgi:hypothetical protein